MPAPEDTERLASTEEYYADARPGYGDAAVAYLVAECGFEDVEDVDDDQFRAGVRTGRGGGKRALTRTSGRRTRGGRTSRRRWPP